jgi:ATP:cob(I)alamin adenosyltransferase
MAAKIYTRGGDSGMTGTHGGARVPKDDPRIEAVGELDELNCTLGVVRSILAPDDDRHESLHRIQCEMMTAMSLAATPSELRSANPNTLDPDLEKWCEGEIDALMARCADKDYFVLPGGTPVAAAMHMARVTARRAERRLWTLHRIDPLPDEVLRFVNRLSDLFFALAREEMTRADLPEELWQSFAYKTRRKQ